MARTKNEEKKVQDAMQDVRDVALNETKVNPETATAAQDRPAVKEIPPANPFNEPIDDAYPEAKYAELTQGTLKPAETIVEHPLSPTDTNPNPHGQRSQPDANVTEKDDNGVEHRAPAKEEVEVTGWHPEGVHVGDGRVIAYKDKMKVSKDQAKDLAKAKKDQGF